MKTFPRLASVTLSLCLAGATIGCTSESSSSATPDVAVDEVSTTSDTVIEDTTDDTSPLPDTLCETLWTRAKSCGHTTTFPGFEAWCAGDGQAVREALEVCKVKPCAQLVTCLDDAGAPSQGL